jgi:hypothetical protein
MWGVLSSLMYFLRVCVWCIGWRCGGVASHSNCAEDLSAMCFEERVFFRLISGMHAAIAAHISSNYPLGDGTVGISLPVYGSCRVVSCRVTLDCCIASCLVSLFMFDLRFLLSPSIYFLLFSSIHSFFFLSFSFDFSSHRFERRLATHPEWIDNMHFGFVFLSRFISFMRPNCDCSGSAVCMIGSLCAFVFALSIVL